MKFDTHRTLPYLAKLDGDDVTAWSERLLNAEVRVSKGDFCALADVLSLPMRDHAMNRDIVASEYLPTMDPTAGLLITSGASLMVPGALALTRKAGRPLHHRLYTLCPDKL